MRGDHPEGSFRKPLTGLAASVVLHALLVAVVFMGAWPAGKTWSIKRGDSLFVELPQPAERAAPGDPAQKPGPPVTAQARPAVKPVPPAPPTPASPRAPAPPPAPRKAEPRKAEPSKAEPSKAESSGRPTPRSQDPAPSPAPTSEAVTRAAKSASEEAPRAPSPAAAAAESAGAKPAPQVASAPPSTAPPVDIRTATGRGGGAGGKDGAGRGGISGDPIALESTDPSFSDYLERLKRQIQAKMVYPCVKDPTTHVCEWKETELILVFGVLKTGQLQFIEVVRPGHYPIYDDFSVRAVQLASPFPPIPAGMMATRPAGATGVPILAQFRYTIATSLHSILR